MPSGRPVGEPLKGQTSYVRRLAFSPDGTTLASAGGDGTVLLWDVASGRSISEPLTTHEDEVSSVAFSADGTRLVSVGVTDFGSGGGRGTVRQWEVTSGQPIGEPTSLHGWVSVAALSLDGTRLAYGDGAAIRVWDVSTGRQIGEPMPGPATVYSVAFSPDGGRLASGDADGTARLWDVSSGRPIGEPLTGHTYHVKTVAFSPDGGKLASAGEDLTVRLWDLSVVRPLGQATTAPCRLGEKRRVESATAPSLRPATGDGIVRLRDTSNGRPIGEPLVGHTGSVEALAFSRDGTRLASRDDAGTVRLWDVLDRAADRRARCTLRQADSTGVQLGRCRGWPPPAAGPCGSGSCPVAGRSESR